jgi:hypothetical protein
LNRRQCVGQVDLEQQVVVSDCREVHGNLKGCAEFIDANSHLDFGDDYYNVKWKSTIEQPAFALHADQKEIDPFIIWYEVTGHYELLSSRAGHASTKSWRTMMCRMISRKF